MKPPYYVLYGRHCCKDLSVQRFLPRSSGWHQFTDYKEAYRALKRIDLLHGPFDAVIVEYSRVSDTTYPKVTKPNTTLVYQLRNGQDWRGRQLRKAEHGDTN